LVTPIPPATKANKRDLGAGVTTTLLPGDRGGWVVATYACRRRYASPVDAPVFARMVYERARPGVDMIPGWIGDVLLQTFSDREDSALRQLLDTLRMTGLQATFPPTEWARLESIVHDLAHTTLSTPWEQQPMPRARKPRRKRLKWRDETGKRRHVYADTLQRYAHLPPRNEEPDTTHAEEDIIADPTDPDTAPTADPVHRSGDE
jgi:hypothetical protein